MNKHVNFGIELLAIAAILAARRVPRNPMKSGAVAGGGTIEGTVVYRGDVPMKKIIPTKDIEVCGGPARGAADPGRRRQGGAERGRLSGRSGQGKGLAGRRQDAGARQRQMPLRCPRFR